MTTSACIAALSLIASPIALTHGQEPAAEPAAEAAPTSEPVVDTSELGDLGMLITPKVMDATAPVLAEAGIEPDQASIRITFLNAENFEYAIRVVLDPSKSLDTAPVLKTCRGCMTDQLVDATVVAVRKAIDRKQAREAKMPDPEPAVVEPDPATDSSQDAGSKPRGLGPLGWGGVGALAVGIASVATGGALVGIGETRPADDRSQFRDLRPPGFGLIGVGSALVITGVALIVVDRVRAKKGSARAAVSPMVSPQHAGLAVVGRF